MHKRRHTGGKRKSIRKKRKFMMARPPAMTKIGAKRVHTVRCRGGNLKFRAMRLDSGNFSWGSEGKQNIDEMAHMAVYRRELFKQQQLFFLCVGLHHFSTILSALKSHVTHSIRASMNVHYIILFLYAAVSRKTRILDVVYNASNNELVRTKTLVKNTIVLVRILRTNAASQSETSLQLPHS